MPGPFPGMDPYLESRHVWRDVHHELISAIRRQLNAGLPRGYATRIDERLYVEDPARQILPDVTIERQPDAAQGGKAPDWPPRVREVVDEPYPAYALTGEEVREAYVEVIATDGSGRVVMVIEVISPSNKRPGPGRDEYVRKQKEILASPVHLLEIDLLRGGDSPAAIDRNRLRAEHGGWDYLVSLVPSRRQPPYEAWTRTLRERLPRVRVPLDPGMPDAALDLQQAVGDAYDAAGYDRFLDYRREPADPPLGPEDAAWADALLRETGLRP